VVHALSVPYDRAHRTVAVDARIGP